MCLTLSVLVKLIQWFSSLLMQIIVTASLVHFWSLSLSCNATLSEREETSL